MHAQLNTTAVWLKALPIFPKNAHKYDHGHTLVIGSSLEATGASRLAAMAAFRAGSGLVTISCDKQSLPIYAACCPSLMTKIVEDSDALQKLICDKRITSILIGPGSGANMQTQKKVLAILETQLPCVLDADALTAFEQAPKLLFDALHKNCVLTPHEGEFSRLFKINGSKEVRAAEAAKIARCTVVLKGHETIIAAPKMDLIMNNFAPSWLATAGSGDVLAGIIVGLLAQKMPTFEAAAAGVWVHSEAANAFGHGMISEDLLNAIPVALNNILTK